MTRVCQLTDDRKYYLFMEPVDMRKQFQGLQGIVNEEFGRFLTQDEAFIFIGKTRKTAKVSCIVRVIDNSDTERLHRVMVMGKKAYLF